MCRYTVIHFVVYDPLRGHSRLLGWQIELQLLGYRKYILHVYNEHPCEFEPNNLQVLRSHAA